VSVCTNKDQEKCQRGIYQVKSALNYFWLWQHPPQDPQFPPQEQELTPALRFLISLMRTATNAAATAAAMMMVGRFIGCSFL